MGYDDWFHGQPAVVCVFRRIVAAIQLESHAGSADEATDKETLAESSDSLDARTVSQHGDGSAALHDPFRGRGPIDFYCGQKGKLAKAATTMQVKIAATAEKAVAVTSLGMRHRPSTKHHPGSGWSGGVGSSNGAMDQGTLTAQDIQDPPHDDASTPHDRGREPLVSGADTGKQPTFRAEYVRSCVAPVDEVPYESAATVEMSGTYVEPSPGFGEAAIKRAADRDVQFRLRALDEQIALASAARDRAEALAVAAEDCADSVQARLVNVGLSVTCGFWL